MATQSNLQESRKVGAVGKEQNVKSEGGIRRVRYINGPMAMGKKTRRKAGTRTESLKFLAKTLGF